LQFGDYSLAAERVDRRLAAVLAADVAFVGGGTQGDIFRSWRSSQSRSLRSRSRIRRKSRRGVGLCTACLRPQSGRLATRSPCSVALDAGGVISAMRPYRHMQSRRVAERCLRGHRTRKSAAIVRIDGEGRVPGFSRGGLRDRLPRRGGRREERGKNERRAQKFEAGQAILLLLARNPRACCPLGHD
jgi:hypothetical protein